jgi:hypothetical protein
MEKAISVGNKQQNLMIICISYTVIMTVGFGAAKACFLAKMIRKN